MDLSKLLGIAVFLAFIPYIFLKKYSEVRKVYLLYILYLFPFIDAYITPIQYGGFSAFDGISIVSFLLIFNRLPFTFKMNGRYLLLFILLFLALFIGAMSSEFFIDSLIPYFRAILLFFFAKCLLDEIDHDAGFGLEIIRIFKMMALISVVFIGLQLVFGLGFTFYGELNTNTNTGAEASSRYPSFFHDAQKYALFAAMTSFLFFINSEKKPVSKGTRVALFTALVLGLILSGGRAAFLGLSVGVVFLILMGPLNYKLLGVLGVTAVATIGFVFSENIPLLNRSESVDESYEIRNNYWQQALRIYDENQTWGIGIGNYRNYVSQYVKDQAWITESGEPLYFDHPESGYLKFLVEFGLIGFCLCMLFFLMPIGSSITNFFKSKKYTPFFLVASIICWMVSFVTVYTLGDFRIAVLLISIVCLLIKSKTVFEKI